MASLGNKELMFPYNFCVERLSDNVLTDLPSKYRRPDVAAILTYVMWSTKRYSK